MDRDAIREILKQAIKRLRTEDSDLLDARTNERSITHRLAVYLEQDTALKGYHVDCEYNRFYNGTKWTAKEVHLDDFAEYHSDQTNGSRVFPDVVVHRRGKPDKNLLVIECKLDGHNRKDDHVAKDFKKLRAYRQGLLTYTYSVFIDLNRRGDEIEFVE
jgi:hypothetical protein